MKNKMLISAVLILAALLLGALAGIALFTRNELEVVATDRNENAGKTTEPAIVVTDRKETTVKAAELAVVSMLIKTHYRAGERIWLSKSLINHLDDQLTVWGADEFLFFRVYDEENRVVKSKIPEQLVDNQVEHKLNLDDVHHGGSWTEHYTFALDQPGRYKILAWAELSLDENWADPRIIYAKPVWLEIVTGREVEFRPVEWRKEGAIPEEVRSWVENSLKFDSGYFANAKEFGGKQYLFFRGGFKVQIINVSVLEQKEVQVEIKIIKPSPVQQTAPDDPYDLVYIKATGLPVRFVPMTSEFILITSLSGIHYLPDIVAQSGSIKVFAPAPGEVVERKFSVSGVASVFEGTVNYHLLDANQNILDSGFITAGQLAPGFTRDPVVDGWLGVANWRYFTFSLEVANNVTEGENLTLELFWVSPKDGVEMDIIDIPMIFKPD